MQYVTIICVIIFCIDTVKLQYSNRCRDNTVGYYPKCHCDTQNYGFNGFRCEPMCPSISDGIYPNCKCRYGHTYNNVSNTCPQPNCPSNSTADSIYPNCICKGKNYVYNEHLNECYLSCPEDSVGFYPNCKCDDKDAEFNKVLFKCMRCPANSTDDSLYPNCKSAIILDASFDPLFNEYKVCHTGSFGKYPNCVCRNGNVYQPVDSYRGLFKAGCLSCSNYNGTYPNCYCPDDLVFDGKNCKKCPFHSIGQFPNCHCLDDYVYNQEENECLKCPNDSTGRYPNCFCKYPLSYRKNWNQCIDCPLDATGIFPFCRCVGKNSGFDFQEANCYECPENSKGRHPSCICNNSHHIYDQSNKHCGIPCDNDIHAYPYCECGNPIKQYVNKTTGKCQPYARIDRPCPPSAIGIGPDCHCVQNGYFFIPYGWGCFNELSASIVDFFGCIGSYCDSFQQSIDPKLLISLVG